MKKEPKKSTSDELYSHINKQIEQIEGNTATWATKQDRFYRLRMRVKKSKNFPFVGCSNIRMPTAETKIRKIKAALINILFGLRPIVQAIPTPSGTMQIAQKVEKFLDHLLMNVMKIRPKSIIAVDQELEKGFFIIKPYYRVEITTRLETFSLSESSSEEVLAFFDPDRSEDELVQMVGQLLEVDPSDKVSEDNEVAIREAVAKALAGDEEIKIKLKDVIYDAPDIELISPEDFYAPTDGGFDVQKLEHCGHKMLKPLHEIKQNAIGKGWDMDAIEEIEAFKDANDKKTVDATKATREGIERLNNPSSLVKIAEWYEWYDLNGDGEPEKCVFTVAPDFKKILMKITLPNDHGQWPFTKLYYELTDDRWYSHRGIVEILEDIIKEIDIQHMQKLDQQTIRNTPMFVYRAGMVNPNMVQFIPNQGIPVHGMNDLRNTIDILNHNNPNVEMSYEREEQILLGRIEECIGQVDFTLQSQVNRREPRTFGEVSLQQQSQQMVFSLDANMHTDAFSDLFQMIWSDWCQYGPDEYEFEYFQDQYEKIKLGREELQGKYRIVVRGNDQNTNPEVKLQKAQAIIQGATNEVAINMGIIQPQHLANAYRLFYQTLDIPEAESYYNPNPQPPPPPPPPPLVEKVSTNFEDLAEGEQVQVLQRSGIQADIPGRAVEKAQELTALEREGAASEEKAKSKKEGSKKSS